MIEAVILLVVGLIEVFMGAIVALVGAGAAVVALLAELAAYLLNRKILPSEEVAEAADEQEPEAIDASKSEVSETSKDGPSSPTQPTAERARPLLPRWLAASLCTLAVLILVVVTLLGTALKHQTISFIVKRAAAKANVAVDFDAVRGSMRTGDLTFEGVKLSRDSSELSSFDIFIDQLEVSIDYGPLLRDRELRRLAIAGMQGIIESIEPKNAQTVKKHWSVESLEVSDAKLKWSRKHGAHGPVEIELVISRLESQPLRSWLIVFDLLFRSAIEGRLNGHQFISSTERRGEAKETIWRIDRLDIDLLKRCFGGAFEHFDGGWIALFVRDSWNTGDQGYVLTEVELILHEVEFRVPEGLEGYKEKLARKAAELINKRTADKDGLRLAISLRLDEKSFEYAGNLEATGLIKLLGVGMLDALMEAAKREGVELIEGSKELIEEGKEKLSGLKERVRIPFRRDKSDDENAAEENRIESIEAAPETETAETGSQPPPGDE